MGNPFLDFFKYWPKRSKKKFRIEIWTFSFKICFQNQFFDFRKWSNWKYTYTRIHVFSVWPLPEVENWFLKQIWNENIHISILNFFLERFGHYLKKSKMDFPFYFKNVILKWPKVFKEIDHGCFWVFGPYYIGKSPCTTCRLTFEFRPIIVRP